MIKLMNRSACCGCSACASICPKGAIVMQSDGLGFKYPKIDSDKCVECGLCEKVCSFNDMYDTSCNLEEPYAYAMRHKDIHAVETSRSGAVFVAVSDKIIDQGGVVYGAGFTENFRVIHKRAETKIERDEFKGSKYVQSDMTGVFPQIKKDLQDGKIVLFSGTPCQTSGLNSYVGSKLRENLYLVDIVCHGVPGPYVWKEYLNFIQEKYKNTILSVNFRDKSEYGWSSHKESFQFESNKIYRNTFTYLFYEHLMFRPSCANCHFANLVRPSDVTLADFWGWQRTGTSMNDDDKGISLVLCNSKKGKKLLESISDAVISIPVELSKCLQPNLQQPSVFGKKWKQFEKDFINKGFIYVGKKYGDMGWRYIIKRFFAKARTLRKIIINRLNF